jgi:hypothetical protein
VRSHHRLWPAGAGQSSGQLVLSGPGRPSRYPLLAMPLKQSGQGERVDQKQVSNWNYRPSVCIIWLPRAHRGNDQRSRTPASPRICRGRYPINRATNFEFDSDFCVRPGRPFWDQDKLERVRQHVASGGSVARASVIFRVSAATVRTKARELGSPFPTVREDRARRNAAMAERTSYGD